MDITEAFRSGGEDITKTDFFDFVVSSENAGSEVQSLHQQLTKQMRSVNVFLGSDGDESSKEANNNNSNILAGGAAPTEMGGVPTTSTEGSFDPGFWTDKETVRRTVHTQSTLFGQSLTGY